MKHVFAIFSHLFIPIAASDCFFLLTTADSLQGVFMQAIVIVLCVNQFAVITLFLSLAADARNATRPLAKRLASLLARDALSPRLTVRQKRLLLASLKRVTSMTQPIGFTDGSRGPFESRSMVDFVIEVALQLILFLQIMGSN